MVSSLAYAFSPLCRTASYIMSSSCHSACSIEVEIGAAVEVRDAAARLVETVDLL